jgi:hypothetical protein
MYRGGDIMDVCIKALVSVNQPTAPVLTTALVQAKPASKQDMALGLAKALVGAPALPASDRDATLLECVRILGPLVASGSGGGGDAQKLVQDVDAAVDAISSDNYAHRCLAMLACGRVQDAYKVAAVEAQSAQLVQEVMGRCSQAPLSKSNRSAKAVVEMCAQYLRFAQSRGGGGAQAAVSSAYEENY